MVETSPADFPDGQIPVQVRSSGLQHPRLSAVYRICIYYNYFRTALESFEPLISRVGQTIRCPLRIQMKWPRIKRAVCASHHIATTASIYYIFFRQTLFVNHIFSYIQHNSSAVTRMTHFMHNAKLLGESGASGLYVLRCLIAILCNSRRADQPEEQIQTVGRTRAAFGDSALRH